MTGGAAAGDFDGDGLVDLFFTRVDAADKLYRNTGSGFEDISEAAGFTQTLTIPSVRTRRTETTLEIPSGGAMAMAGLIQDQTKALKANLGKADKAVLDKHLESVRDVERRVQMDSKEQALRQQRKRRPKPRKKGQTLMTTTIFRLQWISSAPSRA